MQGEDLYSGSALGGAASGAVGGAALGSSIAPGYGTVIGGVLGAGVGLFTGAEANSMRSNATNQEQSALDAIIAQMNQTNQQQYAQHIADLKQTMAYYGPATQEWNYLYGNPPPASQATAQPKTGWGTTGAPKTSTGGP